MSEPARDRALVEVLDLTKNYAVRRGFLSRVAGHVRAVDGVSFAIPRRRTLGLVGESGCGKTTTGRLLLRLVEASAGRVRFDGREVLEMSRGELRALRRRAQIVFQDPFGSLNPRMTVAAALAETLRIHRIAEGAAAQRRMHELLELVGLRPEHARRYPHEFSGGQRQRIGIARALSVSPEFIVADEPVSALDVSVQAQILNLLMDLQRDLGLTYLFIAHDLGVVRHVSDRIAVMYLGRIVEHAGADELFREPLHPYTQALLSAVPRAEPGARRDRIVLGGDVPSPTRPPAGCPFHPRCFHPQKDDECRTTRPPLEEKRPGHWAACLKVPVAQGVERPLHP